MGLLWKTASYDGYQFDHSVRWFLSYVREGGREGERGRDLASSHIRTLRKCHFSNSFSSFLSSLNSKLKSNSSSYLIGSYFWWQGKVFG